jgi:hypothetical protein
MMRMGFLMTTKTIQIDYPFSSKITVEKKRCKKINILLIQITLMLSKTNPQSKSTLKFSNNKFNNKSLDNHYIPEIG